MVFAIITVNELRLKPLDLFVDLNDTGKGSSTGVPYGKFSPTEGYVSL